MPVIFKLKRLTLLYPRFRPFRLPASWNPRFSKRLYMPYFYFMLRQASPQETCLGCDNENVTGIFLRHRDRDRFEFGPLDGQRCAVSGVCKLWRAHFRDTGRATERKSSLKSPFYKLSCSKHSIGERNIVLCKSLQESSWGALMKI